MLPPLPRNLDLEAALSLEKEREEEQKIWAIYGDWLQSQGHPLGEQVALELAFEKNPRNKTFRRLILKHMNQVRETWEKELPASIQTHENRPDTIKDLKDPYITFKLVWLWAFINDLSFKIELADDLSPNLDLTTNLLKSPLLHFLRALNISVGTSYRYNIDTTSTELANYFSLTFRLLKRWLKNSNIPSTLMVLELKSDSHIDPGHGPDIAGLLESLPSLETLILKLNCRISRMHLPNLKVLKLFSGAFCEEQLDIVTSPELPELEALSITALWNSTRNPVDCIIKNNNLSKLKSLQLTLQDQSLETIGGLNQLNFPDLFHLTLDISCYVQKQNYWDRFRLFFKQVRLPALTELYIEYESDHRQVLLELIDSPILRRLKKLGFKDILEAEVIALFLLNQPEPFLHLDSIILAENILKAGVQTELRKTFGNVIQFER